MQSSRRVPPVQLGSHRISAIEGTIEDGLRALREASELAKSIRIELDDGYLALIARVEARPENQSGAGKSWVWRLDRAFRDVFKLAKYVGRAR